MKQEGIELVWVVVKDFDQAIAFYTNVLGFKVTTLSEEFGWAELAGADGCVLGIARENEHYGAKAGTNAVPTITVEDMEIARNELIKHKVKLDGEVMEVPGHVKLQTFSDADGNTFQLCQVLGKIEAT